MNRPVINGIIENLIFRTESSLRGIQFANSPHLVDFDLELVISRLYTHMNFTERNDQELIYRINNDKLFRKRSFDFEYKGSLLYLIENSYVYPIMLFIDGEFIPYEYIEVITDDRQSYLKIIRPEPPVIVLGDGSLGIQIDGNESITLPRLDNVYQNIATLSITATNPLGVIRINGSEISPIREGTNLYRLNSRFMKDDDVNILSINAHNTTITGIQYSIDTKLLQIPKKLDVYKFQSKIKYEEKSFSEIENYNKYTFIFNNGRFISEDEFNSPFLGGKCQCVTYDKKDSVEEERGAVLSSKFEIRSISKKYTIELENLLVFNDGYLSPRVSTNGNNIFDVGRFNNKHYYVMYYHKENQSVHNISKYTHLIKTLQNIRSHGVPESLLELFEFGLNLKRGNREQEFKQVLKYIIEYNPVLLEDYVHYHSNIEIQTYGGIDIIKNSELIEEENLYRYKFEVYKNRIDNCGLIVFKDGLLYNHYEMTYDAYDFHLDFNTDDLKDDTAITVMIFHKVFNQNCEIEISSKDDEKLVGNFIPKEYIQLKTSDINDHLFEIPEREELQYDLFTNVKDKGKGYVTFDMDDYYYNKNLYLYSDRQFKHSELIVQEEHLERKLAKFELPDTFKFCNNRYKYLVFHNGHKLDNSDCFVCLNNRVLPFDKRFLHITKKCELGDRLDVYYVPEIMRAITVNLQDDGLIDVDQNEINYNLDTKALSLFVNGKRVLDEYVTPVSSTKLRVNKDIETRLNAHILQHVYHQDTIFEMLELYDNIWDRMVDELSQEQMDIMFPSEGVRNIEEDFMVPSFQRYKVVYDIIRRYWIYLYGQVNHADDMTTYLDPITKRPYIDYIGIVKINSVKTIPIYSANHMYNIVKRFDELYGDRYTITKDGIEILPMDASKKYLTLEDLNMKDNYKDYQGFGIDMSILFPYYFSKIVVDKGRGPNAIAIDSNKEKINPIVEEPVPVN